MIAALIHATIFVIYATLAIAVGYGSYAWYDYSVGVSLCLGGLVATASGLIHLVLTPRKARLARKDVVRIDNEFLALKDVQTATKLEIEAVRDTLTQEAEERAENLTRELREIAMMIAAFAQKTDQKLAAAAAAGAASGQKALPKRSDQSLLNAVRAGD